MMMMMRFLALVVCLCLLHNVQSRLTHQEALSLKNAKFPTTLLLSSYQNVISGVSGPNGPEWYQWSGNNLNLKGNFSHNNKIWNLNGMAIGPNDNLLYAIGQAHNETQWNVYRFNRTTGKLHENYFITLDTFAGIPSDIAFGYDGNIYIALEGNVYRFHSKTGVYMGIFATTLADYEYFIGMLFSNTDGLLYMTNYGYASGIVSFDGTTGASIGVVGVGNIQHFCQDSNGYLYLPNTLLNSGTCRSGIGGVLRYRPNIDPIPEPFIVTGNGIFPFSCSVGTGSMNDTLIVADPCNNQFRLYNLFSGNLMGLTNVPAPPVRFIDWNDVNTVSFFNK